MAGAREPVVGWLTRVVELHDRIIARYGGASGILDESMLRAAIERPWTGLADGTQYYPSVLDKAAQLLERLINYHPFVDGNKRTATILTFEFLREQGYVPEAENEDIVDVAVRIAEKRLVQSDIVLWLDRITPVRVREFGEAIPCPWCGSQCVTEMSRRYFQPGPMNAGQPKLHSRPYWQCSRCSVTFTSGDHILLVDGVRYLLHMRGLGDPLELAGRVVTGPWWTQGGQAPREQGGIVVTAADLPADARDFPTLSIAEVVAALRAKWTVWGNET
jgi:death on curing protein